MAAACATIASSRAPWPAAPLRRSEGEVHERLIPWGDGPYISSDTASMQGDGEGIREICPIGIGHARAQARC